MTALDCALHMKLLHRPVLDQRHAGFERGDVDQDIFGHGHDVRLEVEEGGSIGQHTCVLFNELWGKSGQSAAEVGISVGELSTAGQCGAQRVSLLLMYEYK